MIVYTIEHHFNKCQAIKLKIWQNVKDTSTNTTKKEELKSAERECHTVTSPKTFWSRWYLQQDKIQVKPSKVPPEPPLVCLITPPHPGIGQKAASDKTYPLREVRIVPDEEKYLLRLLLKCNNFSVEPKGEACICCFKKNYNYAPPLFANRKQNKIYEFKSSELRNKLIDLFGESVISDKYFYCKI